MMNNARLEVRIAYSAACRRIYGYERCCTRSIQGMPAGYRTHHLSTHETGEAVSESLPGYDEWKTHDPRDDEPEEPQVEEDPDDARDRAIEDKILDKEFGVIDDDIEF